MCAIYFLLDSIFVSFFSAAVGMAGIMIIFNSSYAGIIILSFMVLNLFMFAGNSRVIVAYVKYKMWQTIIYKISILLGLFAYLILASYFILNSFNSQIEADTLEILK